MFNISTHTCSLHNDDGSTSTVCILNIVYKQIFNMECGFKHCILTDVSVGTGHGRSCLLKWLPSHVLVSKHLVFKIKSLIYVHINIWKNSHFVGNDKAMNHGLTFF